MNAFAFCSKYASLASNDVVRAFNPWVASDSPSNRIIDHIVAPARMTTTASSWLIRRGIRGTYTEHRQDDERRNDEQLTSGLVRHWVDFRLFWPTDRGDRLYRG
jgi:hypothetical protein